MRSSIQSGQGNCVIRDPTSILHIVQDSCTVNGETMSITDAAIIKKYGLMDCAPLQDVFIIEGSQVESPWQRGDLIKKNN